MAWHGMAGQLVGGDKDVLMKKCCLFLSPIFCYF